MASFLHIHQLAHALSFVFAKDAECPHLPDGVLGIVVACLVNADLGIFTTAVEWGLADRRNHGHVRELLPTITMISETPRVSASLRQSVHQFLQSPTLRTLATSRRGRKRKYVH
jgi:hypothetical protein